MQRASAAGSDGGSTVPATGVVGVSARRVIGFVSQAQRRKVLSDAER